MRLTHLLLACATGCGETYQPLPDCSDVEVPSVELTVRGEGGVAVPAPVATYTVDGAEEAPCVEGATGGLFTCGLELSGLFRVTADGDGFEPASAEVTVGREPGGCRDVVTEALTLELPLVVCPDIERPSLRLLVIDTSGGSVPDARAEFVPLGLDWTAPEPCRKLDPRVFECGGAYSGPIELWTYGTGFSMDYRVVDVFEDECGVVTTEVTVVMKR